MVSKRLRALLMFLAVLRHLDSSVFAGNGFRSHVLALLHTFSKGLFRHRLGRLQTGTPTL